MRTAGLPMTFASCSTSLNRVGKDSNWFIFFLLIHKRDSLCRCLLPINADNHCSLSRFIVNNLGLLIVISFIFEFYHQWQFGYLTQLRLCNQQNPWYRNSSLLSIQCYPVKTVWKLSIFKQCNKCSVQEKCSQAQFSFSPAGLSVVINRVSTVDFVEVNIVVSDHYIGEYDQIYLIQIRILSSHGEFGYHHGWWRIMRWWIIDLQNHVRSLNCVWPFWMFLHYLCLTRYHEVRQQPHAYRSTSCFRV